MFILQTLYNISQKEINLNNKEDIDEIIRLALFGTSDIKAAILYKLNKNINKDSYKLLIDIIDIIIDSTEFSDKTINIYQSSVNILKEILDYITPNTVEYYKTIILTIKITKLSRNTIFINSLLNKLFQILEIKDKDALVRHVFPNVKLKINMISDNTLNLLLSNILQEKEENISNYLLFLDNISYMPYLEKISIDNIIKISNRLSNLKNKIKSIKLRKVLINILFQYFQKVNIDTITQHYEKIKEDLFLEYLLVNRIIREFQENPETNESSKLRKLLSKISIHSPSLIRGIIYKTEELPLYIRVNSFKTRKYKVEQLKKYYNEM